jgi:beta-glucanase (GH16 family)
MRSNFFSAAALLAVAQLVAAQTSTVCQPLEKTCPDDLALGTSKTIDFTSGESSDFTALPGTTLKHTADGVEFDITNEKQAPTMASNWYFFFGSVEVVMRASDGRGIVSSFVLESDDLDEVDWEWIGSDTTQVQSNYFGKGDDSTFDRGGFHGVSNPQAEFHTYRLDWTAEKLVWSINGAPVRTLLYADAKAGTRYPQTPMKVKIGSWVAGSSTAPKGTVEWAGGLADFTNNPTYKMVVKSVKIVDANTGAKSYSYGDKTGSWQSIKIQDTTGNANTGSESSTKVSSTVAPSSTKASSSATKASSTSTKEHSSTSTKESSSTMTTVVSSSTGASNDSATDAPTATGGESSSATTTGASTPTNSTGAGAKLGANLAMVGAVVAFFAL